MRARRWQSPSTVRLTSIVHSIGLGAMQPLLLQFQEPVAPTALVGGSQTERRQSGASRQQASITVGTKTVTEVRAEASDSDPHSWNYTARALPF